VTGPNLWLIAFGILLGLCLGNLLPGGEGGPRHVGLGIAAAGLSLAVGAVLVAQVVTA